eukprot:TRINITY_DN24234_c0_g1_i1.p1 TRINITY_DN24234_c0_g1~~TRINITY_DN24234_c0_g1_i1.p1  ORF type:complete len:293 (-),score=42.97 TRINITY_DN24234_c0_g1_i1:252-1130(-)
MSTESNVTPVGELTVCSAMCCSITGWDCETIYRCFGCGVDGICLCVKQNSVCCKLVDERTNSEGKLLKCSEGGCFFVMPHTCIQQQQQCCCCDTRCAFPCTEQVPCLCTCLPCCVIYPQFGCLKKVKDLVNTPVASAESKQGKVKVDLTDVPVENIKVCSAMCCSICGFFLKMPECLGGKCQGVCLCCQIEESCCKVIKAENEDKICCVCCDGGSYLVIPKTCVEMQEQFFCIDSRCAFPCTDNVPCICTCLPGCVVCASKEVKIACCPLVGDISPKTKVHAMTSPGQMEMD